VTKKKPKVRLTEEDRVALVEFLTARVRLLKTNRQPLVDQAEAVRSSHLFNEKEIVAIERMLRVLLL